MRAGSDALIRNALISNRIRTREGARRGGFRGKKYFRHARFSHASHRLVALRVGRSSPEFPLPLRRDPSAITARLSGKTARVGGRRGGCARLVSCRQVPYRHARVNRRGQPSRQPARIPVSGTVAPAVGFSCCHIPVGGCKGSKIIARKTYAGNSHQFLEIACFRRGELALPDRRSQGFLDDPTRG